MTTQTIAASISDQFRTQTRPDGSNYTTAEEGSAARELVQKIHFDVFDGMFPNDWVYEKTRALVDSIEEYDDPSDYLGELADSNVDIYTHDLLMWVDDTQHFMEYVDEAMEKLEPKSLTQAIQLGQFAALGAMASVILQFMEDAEADEEADEERTDPMSTYYLVNHNETFAVEVDDNQTIRSICGPIDRKDTPKPGSTIDLRSWSYDYCAGEDCDESSVMDNADILAMQDSAEAMATWLIEEDDDEE